MNQVVKKEEGALAVNMFEADADKGSQNMTQDDLALPFLKVLGQLSPEVNKVHARYVRFDNGLHFLGWIFVGDKGRCHLGENGEKISENILQH